jgi:hypothetical protein
MVCGVWITGTSGLKLVGYVSVWTIRYETASTVVSGDAESVGAQVFRLLFSYTLLLLLYLLPRTAKVRICHHIRIRTVYQTQCRTKEAERMSEWGMNGEHNSHCHFRTPNLLANSLHFRVFSKKLHTEPTAESAETYLYLDTHFVVLDIRCS